MFSARIASLVLNPCPKLNWLTSELFYGFSEIYEPRSLIIVTVCCATFFDIVINIAFNQSCDIRPDSKIELKNLTRDARLVEVSWNIIRSSSFILSGLQLFHLSDF